MKKIVKNLVIAAAVLGALIGPAKALTITTTISSFSVSSTQALLLNPNESLAYSLTGTATGQVLIEKSINASEWTTTGITVTGAGSVSSSGTLYSGGRSTYYRITRSTFSAGSLTTSLSDRDDLVTEFKNNKQQRILAINDDSVVISGGLQAQSSTFTSVNLTGGTQTNPTLSGAISVASGSTITYTSAIVAGTKTDNSTTTFTGQNTFAGSTTIKGTTTNDNAAAGYIGEYTSSMTVSAIPAASLAFSDLAAVVLTPGDWSVSGNGYWVINGSTWSAAGIGISTTTGNSSAGLVFGDTRVRQAWASSVTDPAFISFDISNLRASLATSTTYYLKISAGYSAGNPLVTGRISARRMR